MAELINLDDFLQGWATWPPLAEHQPTFFSIARIDHKELPLSNTYAFFFDSQGPHGLGTVFMHALLDVLKQKACALTIEADELGPIHAEREYPIKLPNSPTKWLDLLLHNGHRGRPIPASATFAVLIEIKVWHSLHNDLDSYWKAISHEPKRGVVLGFRREPSLPAEWVFVSHLELALAIEQRLQGLPELTNPYYQPVLQHFLTHIKNMSGVAPESFAQAFAFAQRHRTGLAQAQQLLKQLQPAWLAEIIKDAFGDNYIMGSYFDDRVHITPKSGGSVDYLVWFGHLRQMEAPHPSFSITLFPTRRDKDLPISRVELIESFAIAGRGVQVLDWFSDGWYNEMILGKDYRLEGKTLEALQSQIAAAVLEDWQPLEKLWAPSFTKVIS